MSQQKNEKHWHRLLTRGLLAGCLLMLVIIIIASLHVQKAKKYARTALARQLAAQAQSLLLTDNPKPETAFLLAIQSMRLMPSGDASQILLDGPLANPVSLITFGSFVSSIAFSPDGRYVAAGSYDGTVRVWETTTDKEIFRGSHDGSVLSVGFGLNGKYLVSSTGGGDSSVRVWKVDTGKVIVHRKYDGGVGFVAISPDGKYMAPVVGYDNTVRVLELVSGKEIISTKHDDAFEGIASLAFSSNGKYIVSAGGRDNTARVWEISTGKEIARMTHDGYVSSVAFSPDGKYVVSSGDNTARVWNALTGSEISRMTHDGYVYRAVFSPDGKYVASGGYDTTVRIWKTLTGKEIHRMAYDNYNLYIAFSPNGKYLITSTAGSNDATQVVQVWEARTGQEIARTKHGGGIRSVAFGPDDKFVASGSVDSTARVWQYLPEDLIAGACMFAPRNLTQVEWRQYIGDALSYQAVCPNLPIELTPAPLINTTPTAYPSSTPSS